jgi:hypothetical protein
MKDWMQNLENLGYFRHRGTDISIKYLIPPFDVFETNRFTGPPRVDSIRNRVVYHLSNAENAKF